MTRSIYRWSIYLCLLLSVTLSLSLVLLLSVKVLSCPAITDASMHAYRHSRVLACECATHLTRMPRCQTALGASALGVLSQVARLLGQGPMHARLSLATSAFLCSIVYQGFAHSVSRRSCACRGATVCSAARAETCAVVQRGMCQRILHMYSIRTDRQLRMQGFSCKDRCSRALRRLLC